MFFFHDKLLRSDKVVVYSLPLVVNHTDLLNRHGCRWRTRCLNFYQCVIFITSFIHQRCWSGRALCLETAAVEC